MTTPMWILAAFTIVSVGGIAAVWIAEKIADKRFVPPERRRIFFNV